MSPAAPCILVTRPQPQAGEWAAALCQAGLAARALPLIAITPPADEAAVSQAWHSLAQHTAVMFVSPAAAQGFFRLRPPGVAWPAGCHAAAPGPGTARLLQALGVPAGQLVMPAEDAEQFDSESLWPHLAPLFPADGGPRSLLLVGGGDAGQPVRGRTWLAERLRERGARVQPLAAYRRGPADFDGAAAAQLATAAREPAGHIWLLSSSESLDHLAAALAASGLPAPHPGWQACCTHPRIAERARQAGFGRILMSRPALADVVQALLGPGPVAAGGSVAASASQPAAEGAPHLAPIASGAPRSP